jgi:hypothetical protein
VRGTGPTGRASWPPVYFAGLLVVAWLGTTGCSNYIPPFGTPNKVVFAVKEISFLGHRVSQLGGLR